MAIKQTAHIIRGMQRDLSPSKQSAEFAIDAKNIRITNRENNTLLSITNEKGTKKIILNNNILGDYLGHTTINNTLILFTRDKENINDYIYKIIPSTNSSITLFKGKLSDENINHIEALGVYESEDIQKVYWIDGVSQPRMINIKNETLRTNVKKFDFIQELQLNETIKVEKSYNSGSFNSGVIQYAFNYYNKNGQESNIVEVTPINYISYEDRGAAPNDYVSNSFKITINNYDKNFDYLRLYSIHRTSLDAIPTVKIITDINLKIAESSVTVNYIDTGIIGETIDPVELLYKGGEYIIPKTLAQKDGTLFFGNIKLNNKNIYDSDFENTIENWRNSEEDDEKNPVLVWGNRVFIKDINLQGYYPFKSYLNNTSEAAGFKSRETYRLGIQFQHKTGRWSDPIWYKDSEVTSTPNSEQSNGLISYKKTIASLYISKELKTWAVNKGYLKVRPIIVYPQEFEKEVIAQGVLCPTVFNAGNRREHTNTVQSSWFFRPDVYNLEKEDYFSIEYGTYAEYRHGFALPNSYKRNSELQNSIYDIDKLSLLYLDKDTSRYDHLFGVDRSILTFHSPEIELGKVNDIKDYKLRIVGISSIEANASDIDITISSSSINPSYGLFKYNKNTNIETIIDKGGFLISGNLWKDGVFISPSYKNTFMSEVYYMIYPWQKNGNLNNAPESIIKHSTLKSKKLSNLKFSYKNIYLDNNIDLNLASSEIFNHDSILRLNVPKKAIFKDNTLDYFTYKGDVDNILSWNENADFEISYEEATIQTSKGYPYWISNSYDGKVVFTADFSEAGTGIDISYSKEIIEMKYKSSPHAVFVLEHSTGNTLTHSNKIILPNLGNINQSTNKVSTDLDGIQSSLFSNTVNLQGTTAIPNAYLWLAELYKEVPNKFEGDNYENNIWYPAGKSKRIAGIPDENGFYHPIDSNIRVEFTQGDTFYARFDSLKTYSDDLDAVNSVTEIGSFMVETRINLDARYDRNRGKQSNLVMNPSNFNLFNDVYNQKNNFFNYRIIDKDIADNTKFPNTIVWSKQKIAGADVDPWTNINMASSLDLDGTKGEITKLVSFKNEIFSFQPEAINHILFNSRVQIPTSDGVPIELANAYKVDGARQLSSVGSKTPLAIKETNRGIYYMDSITKGIYVFNGQQSEPLSDKLGMSSWTKEQDIESYQINYDKINQDIYFINSDYCLGYSEKINQFESFYSYEDSNIFNIENKTYAIKNNNIYELFAGEYNNFFDSIEDYYITITHNENPLNDKIYNTLEFRADTYEGNTLSKNIAFNKFRVYNEYQDTGYKHLIFNKYSSSNLKRKFRIWRANIPRDSSNNRDRIRNTWTNITLKACTPSNTKTELHDLVVSYFM